MRKLSLKCREQELTTLWVELVLEENYWIHVELFSMHITELPGALDELIAVYLHGRADLATSTTSTFPYSPQVADAHLDVLMRCRCT